MPGSKMVSITSKHEELIEALTMGVRFLSIGQLARAWFDGDEAVAISYVMDLEAEKLATMEPHLVHPEFDVVGPEFEWTPGDGAIPDFKPIEVAQT